MCVDAMPCNPYYALAALACVGGIAGIAMVASWMSTAMSAVSSMIANACARRKANAPLQSSSRAEPAEDVGVAFNEHTQVDNDVEDWEVVQAPPSRPTVGSISGTCVGNMKATVGELTRGSCDGQYRAVCHPAAIWVTGANLRAINAGRVTPSAAHHTRPVCGKLKCAKSGVVKVVNADIIGCIVAKTKPCNECCRGRMLW
jgi:hypothetical protein